MKNTEKNEAAANPSRLDIVIIGSGPAGISAAITATIRNKKVKLFGDCNLSNKIRKAERIDNYLGLPSVSGRQLAAAFEKHLQAMQIDICPEKVITAYSMGSYFMVQTTESMYEATAIILATGINFAKPLSGEEEFLGRGVSYCATCDAPLYRGKDVMVIGYDANAEREAEFLSEIAGSVTYLPVYQKAEKSVFTGGAASKIKVVQGRPEKFEGGFKAETLVTTEGEYKADGFFLLRESIAPAQLVPGMKMDGNHVQVTLKMETSLPGCFACGDIAGKPYQYIKSAGQGNVAALSAVAYVDQLEKAEMIK